MADIKKRLDKLNDLYVDILNKIDEYNKALKDNDLAKTRGLEQELKEIEKDYAEVKRTLVFDELKNEENPVKAAITTHSYYVVSHRTEREEGVITGFEIVEDKVCQIDLVKFCKHCSLPTNWQYMVEKFNQLMAMRTATELKMTKAQIKKICDSFYMNSLAKKVDLGETPTSNTAICKQLQKVFDAILFEAPAENETPVENTDTEAKPETPAKSKKIKNIHRVNNHDVAYLLMCYSKRGKKTLSVAVAKNSYVHRLVMDVMHRVVTGKTYDLEYRMIKAKDSSESSTKDETPVNADVKPEVSAEEVETIVIEKTA